MSADNRTVATDALATLGTIIDSTAGRDAIHLAVEPVTAGMRLLAGQHVTLRGGLAVTATPGGGLGIVDPFIDRPVDAGEMFWLVIYPRQITSLRHVWEHPAFGAAQATASAASADGKAEAEEWLRAFVARSDCPGYEEVIGRAAAFCRGDTGFDDEYLHFDGTDAHGEIPAEFWTHFEAMTGLRPETPAAYFSCSC